MYGRPDMSLIRRELVSLREKPSAPEGLHVHFLPSKFLRLAYGPSLNTGTGLFHRPLSILVTLRRFAIRRIGAFQTENIGCHGLDLLGAKDRFPGHHAL